MPLSSLLERFRRGTSGTTSGARAPSPSDVEALRTRARRRLIGMVVLVGAGVLGLPWLFETKPRPMSSDVRIVQAGQHASGEVDASPRAATGRVGQATSREAQVANITPPAEATDSASAQAQSSAEARPEPRAAAKPETKSEIKPPAPKPAEKTPEKAPAKSAEKVAQKPQAKPADKAADKKPDAKADNKSDAKSSDTRYVVQFGAFADVNAARETRQKAERMGLKTYAQQVDTPQGKRIRVRLGPFADKAEADKALATLRKGGLNGNVLTL